MHNWSVDIKKLGKYKEKFAVWRLEQLINFGTDGKKIKKSELLKYWKKLHLDKDKRRFLTFLLWGKKSLLKSR